MMKKSGLITIFYRLNIIIALSVQSIQSSDASFVNSSMMHYDNDARPTCSQRIDLIDAHIKKAPCFNTQLAARIMNSKSRQECLSIIFLARKIAHSHNCDTVTMHDFYEASLHDNISFDTDSHNQSTFVYSPTQKFITAIHEIGHAMAIALLNQNGFPYRVYHVTIDPKRLIKNMKGGKTSAAQLRESVNAYDYHHPLLLINLASGVAEQMFDIHTIDKGFSDPDQVTFSEHDVQAAHPAFMQLMNNSRLSDDVQEAIRHFCLIIDPSGQLYGIYRQHGLSGLHQETQAKMYQYLFIGYIQAHKLLHPHKHKIEKVANLLIEKNSITGEEFYETIGLPQPLFDFEVTYSV